MIAAAGRSFTSFRMTSNAGLLPILFIDHQNDQLQTTNCTHSTPLITVHCSLITDHYFLRFFMGRISSAETAVRTHPAAAMTPLDTSATVWQPALVISMYVHSSRPCSR